MTTPPLAGVRVLDLTWNLPGPYTSLQLRALGASILKVEPPRGDPARSVPGLYEPLNQGKEVVTLDLRTPEGQARLQELIRGADVVLEGFRPGVAERLGCGPEQVRALQPRAIYCSITAYGRQGPRSPQPAHDLNIQALAGTCHLARDASGRPHGLPLPIADLSASMTAVSAICAALLGRERDGQGRTLDVAMLDAAVSWTSLWSRGVDFAGQARSRAPSRLRPLLRPLLERLERLGLHALPHYDLFACADGRWLALAVVDEDHFWRELCLALGLGRASKLRLAGRVVGGPVLRRLIARRLRSEDRTTWLARLEAAGIPATPVLTPAEALEDPAVRSRLVGPGGELRAPVDCEVPRPAGQLRPGVP